MGPTVNLEEFRPLVSQLRALQRHCRPFGADYDAIALSLAALDETAEIVTGKTGFFGAQRDSVGPIRPQG